jgi:hypothetical protein
VLTPALFLFLVGGGAVAPVATPTAAATLTLRPSRPTPPASPLFSAELFVDRPLRDPPDSARLGIGGRLDLGHFAAALKSSFALWSISIGLQDRPPVTGLPAGPPHAMPNGLLVGRIGYGLYLGRPQAPKGGELFVYYDRGQRRTLDRSDPRNVPAFARHNFGAVGTLFLSPGLGVQLNAEAGRSWSAGLALVGRW